MYDRSAQEDAAPFVKMPPAAFYDERLKRNHLCVLAVLSEHRDYKTDETDLSQVQLAQALNKDRRFIHRLCRDLVAYGYVVERRRNRHNAHWYWINFAHRPVTQGAHVTQEAHATQEAHSPVTQGALSPVTPEAHSSGKTEKKERNAREARSNGRPLDGGEVDYWNGLLLEADFKPGTPLVVEGRNLGFARENKKDALQEQQGHFSRHRENRGFSKPAKRSEFRDWLREAAKRRSDLIPVAASKKAPSERENASGDELVSYDFRPAPAAAAPKYRPLMQNGTPPAWRETWLKVLAAVQSTYGDGAAMWMAAATIENHNGLAVIRCDTPARARHANSTYLEVIAATWGDVAIKILAPREKLETAA